MRVKRCCFGCSLQTGTLILLWIDLIGWICQIVKGIAHIWNPSDQHTITSISQLPSGVICLVVVIFALIGVEKRRPSFMLPYIIVSVVELILLALFVLLICVGYALQLQIIDHFTTSTDPPNMHNHADSEKITEAIETAVYILILGLMIIIALHLYFTILVYSYYKQLQEELMTGVSPNGTSDQQNKAIANNVYPPAFYQQTVSYTPPNRIYPPKNPIYFLQTPVYPQKTP